MKISILEIDKLIKEFFKDSEAFTIKTTYEKIEGSEDLKLIIFFHKLYYEKTNILYTKLIFVVDSNKTYLTRNNFLYLYDINCVYKRVEFEDLTELEKRFKLIFEQNKFGDNIKTLSEFIKKPAYYINDWLYKHDVDYFTVYDLKYEPKITIIPCKSLFFSFKINISNKTEVEFSIIKENDNLYRYDFEINNQKITIEKPDLSTLVETISDTLKNKIKI